MTYSYRTRPDADPANKVRVAISAIFGSQVSYQLWHCKKDQVHFTALQWQNNGRQNSHVLRTLFSELYNIMVNKVTFLSFRREMLEVMYSRIVICIIVEISSLATACIGQPLLTFWSHPEQSFIFALIVSALKITYIVLQLYCLR